MLSMNIWILICIQKTHSRNPVSVFFDLAKVSNTARKSRESDAIPSHFGSLTQLVSNLFIEVLVSLLFVPIPAILPASLDLGTTEMEAGERRGEVSENRIGCQMKE